MLAHNFKTAIDLQIPETHRQALIKTLVYLETDKLTHHRTEFRFGRHRIPEDGSAIKMGNMAYLNMSCKPTKFDGLFNMNVWSVAYECGTIACLGGTAEMIGHVTFGSDLISNNEALNELFYPFEMTNPHIHDRISFEEITTKHAAQALRNYLTNGAANWESVVPPEVWTTRFA